MEIEFLIFNFSPSAEFHADVSEQLCGFDRGQINCLIHFFEWCYGQPHWDEFFAEDIKKAIAFLRAVG